MFAARRELCRTFPSHEYFLLEDISFTFLSLQTYAEFSFFRRGDENIYFLFPLFLCLPLQVYDKILSLLQSLIFLFFTPKTRWEHLSSYALCRHTASTEQNWKASYFRPLGLCTQRGEFHSHFLLYHHPETFAMIREIIDMWCMMIEFYFNCLEENCFIFCVAFLSVVAGRSCSALSAGCLSSTGPGRTRTSLL